MLELKDIQVTIHKKKVLSGLSFQVKDGTVLGLLGPNGSGKTTIFKVIAGLLEPEKGSVFWNGEDLLLDSRKRKSLIGYVPDRFGVYINLRVAEYMEFFANAGGLDGLKGRKTGLDCLDWFGLADKQNEYVEALSRSMKQRLSLARAMLHRPKILLIDEPSGGFDPEGKKYMREALQSLKESKTTILLNSHVLSELPDLCSEIGILQDGKMILQGNLEGLRKKMRLNTPLEISVRKNGEEASALLRKEPSVKTIAREENRLFLTVDGGEEEESRLLNVLVQKGIPVYSFVRRQGDLDNLFFSIMEKKEKVVSSNETQSGTV